MFSRISLWNRIGILLFSVFLGCFGYYHYLAKDIPDRETLTVIAKNDSLSGSKSVRTDYILGTKDSENKLRDVYVSFSFFSTIEIGDEITVPVRVMERLTGLGILCFLSGAVCFVWLMLSLGSNRMPY